MARRSGDCASQLLVLLLVLNGLLVVVIALVVAIRHWRRWRHPMGMPLVDAWRGRLRPESESASSCSPVVEVCGGSRIRSVGPSWTGIPQLIYPATPALRRLIDG